MYKLPFVHLHMVSNELPICIQWSLPSYHCVYMHSQETNASDDQETSMFSPNERVRKRHPNPNPKFCIVSPNTVHAFLQCASSCACRSRKCVNQDGLRFTPNSAPAIAQTNLGGSGSPRKLNASMAPTMTSSASSLSESMPIHLLFAPMASISSLHGLGVMAKLLFDISESLDLSEAIS